MDYFFQRRALLAKSIKAQSLDCALITNPVNVRYLTGFTGDSSYLLVNAKRSLLISDSRFELQIQEECKEIDVHIRPHTKKLPEATAELLAKSGAKIGFEAGHLTVQEFEFLQSSLKKVSLVATSKLVEALRVVKDPSELEQIRIAVKVAERGFRMFLSNLDEHDTEKACVDALESFIRRAGGHKTSFPPIVAVGERGALPHAVPTLRRVNEGSKLLVDWGADLAYKSDITRTLKTPYGGAPNRKNKIERSGFNFDELYSIVNQARLAAVQELRAGVVAKAVDAAARRVFSKAKLSGHPDLKLNDYFTHGLGHGIGLEVHESPSIRTNSEDVLEAGMVVTIEPGIYIPEWGGIRLEDDYLITKDGAIPLTTLPHDPDALMV